MSSFQWPRCSISALSTPCIKAQNVPKWRSSCTTLVRHVSVFCSMLFFCLYRASDFTDSVRDFVVLKNLMSYLKTKICCQGNQSEKCRKDDKFCFLVSRKYRWTERRWKINKLFSVQIWFLEMHIRTRLENEERNYAKSASKHRIWPHHSSFGPLSAGKSSWS